MSEPLSYKELEQTVKKLQLEKQQAIEELEKIEKRAHSKEEFYQQIFDLTNEGIMLVQGDRVKFINNTTLLLLESSKSEIDKMSFSDLIHNNNRGHVIQQISDIISGTLKNSSIETDIVTPGKKVIQVRIVVERLNNLQNQNLLLIKIEDIQKYKEKEKEAKSLRSVVDMLDQLITEGVIVLTKPKSNEKALFSWIIEDVNKAGIDFIKANKKDVIGDVLGTYFMPDYEYEVPDIIDSSYNDEFELYLTNLKKYVKFNVKWINERKISCQFVDITDLNFIKNQLNINLQRNELIAEVLNVFNSAKSYPEKLDEILQKVAYQFKNNRILIVHHTENNSIGKLLTQYAKSNLNEFADDFIIPFEHVPSYLKMLNERKMILGFLLKYLPEDLQRFFKGIQFECAYVFPIMVENNMFGSIIFDNKGDVELDNTEINYLKMISVLISSLIARYRNEEKIINAKNKAEEADRLKSSFLANMSHDIRIPMTAIIGFSDLLADPDLTIGEREEFIELISKSGQDLLTLVDNIIDVAKIETGQFRIQNEKVSLEHLLKDLFASNLKNSKINNQDDLELVLDFNEKYQNMPFETDVFRIKQVLNNLIDNAIKFTENGVIRFGVSNVYDNRIEFFVQDTGIGIAEETQHIIFERFSKIDQSYTKEYNGTGLGLALSKSIIELMKGSIRVLSYPGKGSTFYFTHPIPEGAIEKLEEKNIEEKQYQYNWEDKIILIAEDVEQNFKYLKFMLHPTKAEVIWVVNGQEAIEFFQQNKKADIVLMDIRMPIVNGIEATKEILKITTVPIIAQTAYTFGDEKHLAMQAGCTSYLSKPIHSNSLLPLLDGIFNKNKNLVK